MGDARDTVLVAIPTRDRPERLRAAIESVIAQDDRGWVAVVADDGERETAAPVVAALADPRVVTVRSRARCPGGARNAAVAHGEDAVLRAPPALVALLDDDDAWLPGHLAAARAALAARPEATFVHGAAWTVSDGDAREPYHSRGDAPLEGDVFGALLRRDFVATSSVVVRGDAWRGEGGMREDLPHAQDWDLWLRLARRGPAAFVAEPLVVYHRHAENRSHALAAKAAAQAEVLRAWVRRRRSLAPEDARRARREYARRARRHVGRLLDAGASRAEAAAAARAHLRAVVHADTLRAVVEARLRPRAR